jgi:predicted metalloendopeptidase
VLADEIMWNIIKTMITAMPKQFREAASELTAIATGIETPVPRWKICVSSTNTNFEYATALLYAEKYLSEEARERVSALAVV